MQLRIQLDKDIYFVANIALIFHMIDLIVIEYILT